MMMRWAAWLGPIAAGVALATFGLLSVTLASPRAAAVTVSVAALGWASWTR